MHTALKVICALLFSGYALNAQAEERKESILDKMAYRTEPFQPDPMSVTTQSVITLGSLKVLPQLRIERTGLEPNRHVMFENVERETTELSLNAFVQEKSRTEIFGRFLLQRLVHAKHEPDAHSRNIADHLPNHPSEQKYMLGFKIRY